MLFVFDNHSLVVGNPVIAPACHSISLCVKCGLCVYSICKRNVVSGLRLSQAESNKKM